MATKKFKRIKVTFQTPFTTPGNGAVSGGKINNLLLIGSLGEENGKHYAVKGLRGLINHSMMSIAQQKGIEVCHSSQKTETKEGENLLPDYLHPNGACYPEDECIKHRLMGSIKKTSIVRFKPVVILSEKTKGKEQEGRQRVHIATNNHNTLVHGTKRAIQDYGERYFSGIFVLTIELLAELSKEELGFLIEAILYAPEHGLGAKVNNGSGDLEILELTFQEVTRTRGLGKNGKIVREEQVRNLWKALEEAHEAWLNV